MLTRWRDEIERQGFCLVPNALSATAAQTLATNLELALDRGTREGAIRSRPGTLYAARNVLELYPAAFQVAQQNPLLELLVDVLGPECGLVRALYFDKPPERSWSLPWHKDLTLAVENNRLPSAVFSHPTHKAGVPHVEGSRAVLAAMLTLRVHLDPVTNENGPLVVLPGSHHAGKAAPASYEGAVPILTQAGDVFCMRPLLAHASGESLPGTALHRRILHLEFAAERELPDGFRWHTFRPCSG